MIDSLVGSASAEKVLLFLEVYEEGYAGEISRIFNVPLYAVQKQLQRLERGGILASSMKGNTRMYVWNPRYAFLKELRALLKKAVQQLPEGEQRKYFRARVRPRRAGKPL